MATGRDKGGLDRKLVENFLRRREEAAFRELYRRHAAALNQLVVRLVGGLNGDAEDVIQTTWIRAIANLTGFRWESNLRTWLTGIAINCSREHLRKRKRTQNYELIESVTHSPVPKIKHEINRIDLERAISNLPDGYREILILHDIEGYTHEEIARFLGIEAGTSKSQLSRARKAVRVLLTGKHGHGKHRKSKQRPEQGREGGVSLAGGDGSLLLE